MKYITIVALLFSAPLLTHEVGEPDGAEQPHTVRFQGEWKEVTLKKGDVLSRLPAKIALTHCDWDRQVIQFTMEVKALYGVTLEDWPVVHCFSNGRDIVSTATTE
jgi:hypothetical protein